MSLKEIAKKLGTSVATVSRVLNDPMYKCQDVELANRIRKLARENNYVPNQNARRLKMGGDLSADNMEKIFSVDILLGRFDQIEADPFFYEVFRILETEFYKNNCVTGEVMSVPQLTEKLQRKDRLRADGLLVLGKCSTAVLETVEKKYDAIMAIDRNPTDYQMDEVVCNGADAAKQAMEYLFNLGHRRIAYIGDCNEESRYIGYYESLIQKKISLTYDYVVPTNQQREQGESAFHKLLECEKRPTAVFCANDVTALGFLDAMKKYNIKKKKNTYIPAVISIDDIYDASFCTPLLSTVHIPKEDMAHLAVINLKDRLLGGHKERIRVELPCSLIVRESSGISIM